MTTIDIIESSQNTPARRTVARTSFFAPLVTAIAAYRERAEERRILVALSRKDSHLLRDMGFEPAEIYDAVRNSWDEVPDAQRRGSQSV